MFIKKNKHVLIKKNINLIYNGVCKVETHLDRNINRLELWACPTGMILAGCGRLRLSPERNGLGAPPP
jgi:hypothetical protein